MARFFKTLFFFLVAIIVAFVAGAKLYGEGCVEPAPAEPNALSLPAPDNDQLNSLRAENQQLQQIIIDLTKQNSQLENQLKMQTNASTIVVDEVDEITVETNSAEEEFNSD